MRAEKLEEQKKKEEELKSGKTGENLSYCVHENTFKNNDVMWYDEY